MPLRARAGSAPRCSRCRAVARRAGWCRSGARIRRRLQLEGALAWTRRALCANHARAGRRVVGRSFAALWQPPFPFLPGPRVVCGRQAWLSHTRPAGGQPGGSPGGKPAYLPQGSSAATGYVPLGAVPTSDPSSHEAIPPGSEPPPRSPTLKRRRLSWSSRPRHSARPPDRYIAIPPDALRSI
jgi:hypothetical protein